MTRCDSERQDQPKNASTSGWLKRLIRALRWLVFAFVAYLGIVVLGLIPVNQDFRSPTNGGVVIYVGSGIVHTDLILPVNASGVDWFAEYPESCFAVSCHRFSHVAIGWGDRGFYLETPTWSDFKASTAANAILRSSESVMHVQFMHEPLQTEKCRRLRLSPAQYAQLVDFIRSSFAHEGTDDRLQPIQGEGYVQTDAFFEAQGAYHAFNTCNCWAANGLESAGVTVPWFSPMPGTVLWYLPTEE